MKRFVEGEDRTESTLFPERLDDYISEDNPVRVIEAFVDELDLSTATSTEFSQAVVWSERVNATSRSCG